MVLDTYLADRDVFIFKNTYDHRGQPKQFQVFRTDPNAPEELYFVHIDIQDIGNLPGQQERRERKKERRLIDYESVYQELPQQSRSLCPWCCFC